MTPLGAAPHTPGGVVVPVDADENTMLRQIIEATPNAMVMVDSAGRITLVNTQTEVLFGYTRDELLSMKVEDLIPERLRPRHEGYRTGFFEGPDRRLMGAGRELFGRRRDGTEIPVEIGLNPIRVRDEQQVLASVIDITERLQVQAMKSAKDADRLRSSILASLPFSIIASDPDGTIVTANPAAERLLGFDRGELVGSDIGDLRQGVSRDLPLLATRPDAVDEREVDYCRKDGSIVPVNEAIALIGRAEDETGAGKEVSGVLSVAYDITLRREAEEFVRHLAHFDVLTDLPNRTQLFERLDEDLRTAVRTGRGVVIALIDLDHFKRVNDALGHHVGDDLLIKMAARLRRLTRPTDLVARLGGDEFVLVLTDIDRPDELQRRIAAVMSAVSEPIICFGHEIVVTASVGLAMSPDAGRDPTTLLQHADTAMYHAKSAGRNAYEWFAEAMLDETNDKLEMAAALRHGLDRYEITVSYQPQVCLLDGSVVGVEALARWRTRDGRDIPPDRFIPAAEDNGLIIQLGEWVLRRACADVVAMSAQTGIALRVAVNVSPRQFHDRGWLDVVRSSLEESGLPPDRLDLEITEGIFMEDTHHVVDVMSTIRALGVGIVVDDFGTGFSSLAYLTRFTVDKIKIDRSFVSSLVPMSPDAAIIDMIIVMAHVLGMMVVAEGVETGEQETYLRDRGCDIAQGFRYSPALTPAELVTSVT